MMEPSARELSPARRGSSRTGRNRIMTSGDNGMEVIFDSDTAHK
jgi:hypothetical protein